MTDLSRNLQIKRYTDDGFSFGESSYRGNSKGMKKPTQSLKTHVRENPTEPAPKVRGYIVNANMEYVKEEKFRKKKGGLRAGYAVVDGKVVNKPTSKVEHSFDIPPINVSIGLFGEPVGGPNPKIYVPTLSDFGLTMQTIGVKFFKIYKNGRQIGDAQVDFTGYKNDTKLFSVFMITSDDSNLENDAEYRVEMYEFDEVKFNREKFPQIYAGVGTCVFDPILEHYTSAKDTKTKQTMLTTINKLIEKYPDGCNEEAMQVVSNRTHSRLRVCSPTNQVIACYEPKIKDGTPQKKIHNTYNYVNTEMNHVDNWTICHFDEAKGKEMVKVETAEEMRTIYRYFSGQDNSTICSRCSIDHFERQCKAKPFIFNRSDRIQGYGGISFIETKDTRFKMIDPTRELMTDLMNGWPEIFCNMYSKIHKFDSSVLNFIHQATYINGLHTLDEECDLENMRRSIHEHDITKAYATFYESDLFDDYGLPRPPTDFIECVGHDPLTTINRIGWTQITNVVLDRSKASHNLSNLIDGNVYPNVELKKLWTLGVRFDVLNTAYTVSQPHTEFRFTKPYLEGIDHPDYVKVKDDGTEVKQKPYAILVGMMTCCSLSNTTNYKYVKQPSQEWIDNLTAYDTEIKKITICKGERRLMLHKPKKLVSSMCHVASYITAYVRCRMYEQIDKYQHPVMVNSDCIKFVTNGELLPEGWSDKTDKIYLDYKERFSGYHNGKDINDIVWDTMKSTDPCALLPQYVFYNGVGGSGKTTYFMHSNFMDKLMTFPTHSLKADKMKNEQNIPCLTHHRYFGLGDTNGLIDKKSPMNYHSYWNWKNIFVDEITMRNNKELDDMIDFAEQWGVRLIFAGDIHFETGVPYQLQPVKEKFTIQPLIDLNCKEVMFTKNHRCKDISLLNKIELVRKNMTNHMMAHAPERFNVNKMTEMFVLFFKDVWVTREEVFSLFDPKKDLILCGTHLAIDVYNKDMHKRGISPIYKLTDKYQDYREGEMFWGDDAKKLNTKNKKEAWATTVHSVQGKTFKGRLFINYKDFFELGMFYTAVSRVGYLNQIRIIH